MCALLPPDFREAFSSILIINWTLVYKVLMYQSSGPTDLICSQAVHWFSLMFEQTQNKFSLSAQIQSNVRSLSIVRTDEGVALIVRQPKTCARWPQGQGH